MGPGFDCIGMALKMYNNLWVEETGEDLVIINKNPNVTIPVTRNNLIYRSIFRFYRELGIKKRIPGLKLTQDDAIPLTRGLGSSAACIVSGLLAANIISGVNMPREELCTLAAKIEEHPDNSTPALVGGVVIGAYSGGKLEYIKLRPDKLMELKFAVMIPDFPLPTKQAREVLPKQITMTDAVYNISRSALMTAALLQGDFSKLNIAMDDRLHQNYRMNLIPGMEHIFSQARKFGAKGVFLSGAGPTVIALFQDGGFPDLMRQALKSLPNKWECLEIEPDYEGAKVEIT
jgi:homoserine kinase